MKKLIVFVIGYITMLGIYSKEIPYTLEDRERLIRVEEGIKFVNQRIDDVKEEIRDLKTFILWGFGILFSGMGILMGFVLWDRRTAISPVIKRTRELEEENEKIYKVLKEMGKRDTKIAQILKQVGIL
jgi:hypothetical protein